MSLTESSVPPQDSPSDGQSAKGNQSEWIYRGGAGLIIAILLWFGYRNRHDGGVLILLAPFMIGAVITALRLAPVSATVNSIENWLRRGSARAAAREGKFARFFQRPFFGSCLAIWRWTARILDVHLRAGVRATTLIFICGIAINLIVIALYVIAVIAVIVIAFAIFFWILSLSGQGERKVVTRNTTDWFGRPKQEHFDESGEKIGESRPDTDWLGQPKMVHEDAEGNIVGESRPDTDWLGNPKTVHTDAEGNRIGESIPDTDWLGAPKTVHTDADGNVIGESREETDLLGRRQTVRYDK
jgi:hypothetical protein